MKNLFALLLLFSLPVLAADPWEGAKLDVAQLEGSLKQAQEQLAAATKESPEEKALARRVELLRELVGTLQDRARFIDAKSIAERKTRADAALEALRGTTPPAGALGIRSKEEVAPYEAAAVQTEADWSSAQRALEELLARQKAAQAEVASLPTRLAEAKRRLESDVGNGSGEAAPIEQGNLALDARTAQERIDFLRDALERWATRLPMQQAERDLARLRLDRALAEQARAREEWAKESERLAQAEREKAVAQERDAARARDPVERFRRSKVAEATRVQAEASSDDAYLALLQQRITDQQKAADALETERGRLAARFALSGSYSERIASLLLGALERFRLSREVMVRRTLPALYREMALYQNARAETQDRIYEMEGVREENREWLALLESVGSGRESEAHQAFSQVVDGENGLLARLRGRAEVLDRIESGLVSLETEATRRLQGLDQSISFLLARILWVKSEPTIGPATMTGAAAELGKLARAYGGAEAREEIGDSYRQAPGLHLAVFGGILLALLAGVFAARKLRHFRASWQYKGGPFWTTVQRVLVALLLSLIIPGLLRLVGLLLGVLSLPEVILLPTLRALGLLSWIWFVRRFLWRLFRSEDGIAVVDLGVAPTVAAELWRSTRLATTSGFVFLLPSELLAGEPFLFEHLTRILYPCFLVGMVAALAPLLLRRSALVGELTQRKGFLYRAWGVVGIVLAVGLACIVLMDLAGYRYGARQLMSSAVQSLTAVILLAGVYRLLRRMVEKLALAVRSRAAPGEGYAAAWEQSRTVLSQLTRVVAAALLLVTFVVFVNAWEVNDAIRGFFEEVQLVQLDGGAAITLWDALMAAVWVGGAHFLLANISGVYEFLVFPLMGGTDRGGRFVMIALSRYVILIVAYSAALLALHFSFSSVGWLLAAASVGLGFGLQEIVANFVSGLILLFEQPVRVGDVISVGTTGGTVEKINIRATVVTNWDRQQIIVPNKNFITQELTNWTRNDDLTRRVLKVGVAYGSDVTKVLRLLKEIVEGHASVVKDPPPRIWFEDFGASSLDFEVWCFIRISEGKQALTEIRTQIAERFAHDGIEIPFPQRDLHIRSIPPDADLGPLLGGRSS